MERSAIPVELVLRRVVATAARAQRAMDRRALELLEGLPASATAGFSLLDDRLIPEAEPSQSNAGAALPISSLVSQLRYGILEIRLDLAVVPGGDGRFDIVRPGSEGGNELPACIRIVRRATFEGEFLVAGEVKGTLREAR